MKKEYEESLKFSIKDFTNSLLKYSKLWVEELVEELSSQPMEVESYINTLFCSKRIFTCGRGRSGMGSIYGGIRLAQAGYEVRHIDDPYKPPIREEDLILCDSSSGETPSVINAAKIAKKNKANIASLTTDKKSKLAKLSNICIILNRGGNQTKEEPIEFLGTKFEFKAICFKDIVANEVIKKKGLSEAELRKNHANLE